MENGRSLSSGKGSPSSIPQQNASSVTASQNARSSEFRVIIPFSAGLSGDLPSGTEEDVDLAVSAARKAFSRDKGRGWSRASGAHRAQFLRQISAKVVKIKFKELFFYHSLVDKLFHASRIQFKVTALRKNGIKR